jgi:signal transduction histidine kinase
MSRRALAAYPWNVKRMPGLALAANGDRNAARTAARRAWHGLVQVLAAPDPAPARSWHSPRERRAAYATLGIATLVLCIVSLANVHGAAIHGPLPRVRPAPVGQLPVGLGPRILAVAVVAPLPLAARYPMLAWRIGWLALLLVPLVPATWAGGWPWGVPQVLALLAAFCLAGVRQPRPALWWMWALSLIPWWLWLTHDVQNLNGPAGATIVFTATVIAVDSIGSWLRARRALAAQTERTEVERARRAVLEERTRIARELHDVVAHHMSLIAVRAETAPYRLNDLPESARAEFGALSEVAREALTDMRRLLGVLRYDQPVALAPQPQLADLPTLVDAARRAGVSIEMSGLPALDQVPSGVGVCAYRIVQESLSNASQHSPGAAVTVSVDHEAGAVLLRVANGPAGPAGPAANGNGPGHGLIGMRERVALLGGSLSAGPAPDGGFVVSAVLPLGQTA